MINNTIRNNRKNNKKVNLHGWIVKTRLLGKILFFELETANSRLQVVIKNPAVIREFSKTAKAGDLISVLGNWKPKQAAENSEENSLELLMESWKLISKTAELPFEIKDQLQLKDDNRYRYRYLDLRRKESKRTILYKHEFLHYIRNFFYKRKFIEIETPVLAQSSPEGAKTFIVPSNIKDHFYTLAQSPQIFKQILMIASFDKYYQIAKTFRNENSRSNRQPEFLQLDLEVSFPKQKTIFKLIEKLLKSFLEKFLSAKLSDVSFQTIKFTSCMEKYGTDKPDLRNPLEVINIVAKDKRLDKKGMFFPFELFTDEKKLLVMISAELGKQNFSLFKLGENQQETLVENGGENLESLDLKDYRNGYYLLLEGLPVETRKILLKLRTQGGKLIEERINASNSYKFVWVTEWPLFEQSSDEKKIVALRHPFTIPKKRYIRRIINNSSFDYLKIMTESYDLVCNGEELASGSFRIAEKILQERIFELLGLSKDEMKEHFGYFLRALEFAAPPHGGIGLGIERTLAVFLKLKNIKEVITFPKNIDGSCSLTGAPNKLKI